MEIFDFDKIHERRGTHSAKWEYYEEDVLPLWVADMDFQSPEPVIKALHDRVEHGIFGYPYFKDNKLSEIISERMQKLYQWKVNPEDVYVISGVVLGFNLAAQTFTQPGDKLIFQTPVYYPFFKAPKYAGALTHENELLRQQDGSYEIDFDDFEAAIDEKTRMFLLCNPHNPVGRVFRRDELEKMAEICLRNEMIICSDEIHCDLIYSDQKHIPIASLSPEVAQNTITLMAPSKTYNIAGLEASIAISPNKELMKQMFEASRGLVGFVNLLGQTAALAAYQQGQPWLDALLVYLEKNRDYLADYVNNELPGVSMWKPEGTYLGWLDCRQAGLGDNPQQFFMEKARVALNPGDSFGVGGKGFARINFGCPKSMLQAAMERMKRALESI